MTLTDFKTTRLRDAWATIQGYVYQVDLTIQRWLNLQPHQILELESGEDIDLVSQSLGTTDSAEQERLLEQVKHREEKITLKNPAAVTMIACAIEHLKTNPNSNLFFRYTTNAEATRERLSPIPDNTPGILVWELIRSGNLQGQLAIARLNNIRSILKQASQPSKLHDDTWAAFSNFVQNSSDAQLLDLVRSLEWGINTSEAKTLGQEIQNTLLSEEYAEDINQAKEQYQRLFLYVFKRLCQQGKKQLTDRELHEQLALPLLSEKDRLLLDNITTWINLIEQRLSAVEEDVSQNKEFISTIDDRVKQLAKAQGIEASISYTVATPILDLPPLVSHLSWRQKTVASSAKTFERHTWLAIHGSMGSGKTQLANLTVRSLDSCCVWIRLRNLSVEQAAMRLDEACKALVSPPSTNRYEWYSAICQKLDRSAVIVLDNLPNLSRGDELSERLIQLTRACQNHQVRLLSTSAYNFPPSFQSNLPDNALRSWQIPLLSEEEAREILEKYNIPTAKTDGFIRFLNDIARQHPLLLNAVGQYLELKNWQLTEEDLNGLFRNNFAAEVNEETIDRLLATVEDSNARELLYRLNLVIGSFSLEDARAIASVEPSIERCRERLRSLTGLWLESDIDKRLFVSPLIKSLGDEDLSEQTRKECYVVLGDSIVQRQKIDQWRARKAIGYYAMAKEYDRAFTILIVILWELSKSKTLVDDVGLLSIWVGVPLPNELSLAMRLFLRGLQISVRHQYGKSTIHLIEDLNILLQQASEKDSWAVVGATLLVNPVLAENQPILANDNLKTTLKLLPNAKNPLTEELLLPDGGFLEAMIWSNTRGISQIDHLKNWIETVECLSEKQLQIAFACELAEHGCQYITERLFYLLEQEENQNDQQWLALLDAINELAYRSYQLGLKLLWACAVRVQIAILGCLNKLGIAANIANTVVSQSNNDDRIGLLIGECLGRQYLKANLYSEAKFWLDLALKSTTTSYSKIRLEALMLRGRIVERDDYQEPIKYIKQAIDLAENSESESSRVTLIKAQGELAIALWLTKGITETFEAWEKAIDRLFKFKKDTSEWKTLWLVCGHVSGYFTHLACKGIPPQTGFDGGSYGADPEIGCFSKYNLQLDEPQLTEHYNNIDRSILFVHLSDFAQAVGNDERASHWALRGIEFSRDTKDKIGLPGLVENAIPTLLLSDKYIETIDLGLDAGAILVAHEKLHSSNANIFATNSLDLEEILGSKPNDLWRRAENYASRLCLIPIAFRLGIIAILHPELIAAKAEEVASLCDQVSMTAADQYLWTSAAKLFRLIYIQDIMSLKNLIYAIDNHFENYFEQYGTLWIMGYLIFSLQKRAFLQDSFLAQLGIMQKLSEIEFVRQVHPSATHRRLILPFLQAYWTTTFNRMQFQFNTPKLIEKQLAEIENIPEAERWESLFRIIGSGLV